MNRRHPSIGWFKRSRLVTTLILITLSPCHLVTLSHLLAQVEEIPFPPTPVRPLGPPQSPPGPSFLPSQLPPPQPGDVPRAGLPEGPVVPHGAPLPQENRGPQPIYHPAGPYTRQPLTRQHPLGAVATFTGTQVRRWQSVQIARANADDYVIYLNEWYLEGLAPGPYGQFHLEQMARRLCEETYPVIIQPDLSKPGLNEARRAAVIARLRQCGVPDAEMRVIIGYPATLGYYGEEAPRIYQRMLSGGQGGGGVGTLGGAGAGGGIGTFGGLGGNLGGVGNVGGSGIGVNYR